ncbi:MAG: hypothetical protein RSD95_16735, partial [Clostridia bacterium]
MSRDTIIPSARDAAIRGEQPLSEAKRAFVDSIYALFEQFRDGNHPFCEDIRLAREVRKLRDSQLDIGVTNPLRKSPQLNTLNSTVDNMVADYMDNLPEAVMQPETPEMGEVADDLTDVVGWALHHAGFKPEWRRAVEDATVTGTGIMHVFWDDEATFGSAQGGIGLTAWR